MVAKFPQGPWEKLDSDLFYHKSQWHLLLVDYSSRFVEIALLSELSSKLSTTCLVYSLDMVSLTC